MPRPSLTISLTAAAAAMLGACSPDDSGVRNWATTASHVVGALDAHPSDRSGIAMRETAIAYLAALSRLAMDGLLRHEADPLERQAAELGGADTDLGRATRSIGGLLLKASVELWRAPQLRQAIVAGNAPFQRVIADLLAADRLAEEAEVVRLTDGRTMLERDIARVRDPATRSLLREAARLREGAIETRAAARRVRRAALEDVARTHEAFAQNPGELSRAEVIRSTYEAEAVLRRALSGAVP